MAQEVLKTLGAQAASHSKLCILRKEQLLEM